MGVTPVHLLQVRSVKSRAAPAMGMMLCRPKPLRSSNPTGNAVGPRDNDAAALLLLVGVSCGLCLASFCPFCLICAIFVLPAQHQLTVCRVLLCKEPVSKKEKQVCSLIGSQNIPSWKGATRTIESNLQVILKLKNQ